MSTTITAGNATNNGASISSDTAGTLQLQTGSTPTTAVTIDTSQNVGVGTASPAAKFEITGGGNSGREPFAVNGTNATDLYTTYRYNTSTLLGYIGNGAGTITSASASDFGIRSQNALAFATGGATERMRITSGGQLSVGTTKIGGRANLYRDFGTNCALATYTDSNNYVGVNFLNTSDSQAGYIQVSTSSVAYNTSSDYRLKENIAPMTGALALVSQLKPVTYTWKADGSNGQGFIAHELAEICPDAVTGEKDAVNEDGTIKPQGIDTSFLVATLTAAIQELNAKVTALEAQLGAK